MPASSRRQATVSSAIPPAAGGGAGLPTTENLHEVAKRTDPTARIRRHAHHRGARSRRVGGHRPGLHGGGHPRPAEGFRGVRQVAFTGLDLVPPGVVLVSEWRPDDDSPLPLPAEVSCYGGVGRKL
ncbi:MAG TPA: SAM-dependent methyltransferase [Trebonia sp.]|nr:SAM-dependent methyltransferase [Trebonia sp.]